MNIVGIESVVYGVYDIDLARKFWTDYGLAEIERGAAGATFETPEGTTIAVRKIDDAGLPAPAQAGATVRELVWGCADAATLDRVGAALDGKGEMLRTKNSMLRSKDPMGFGVSFAVTARRPLKLAETPFNGPARAARLDRRGEIYKQARPQHIAHIVFTTAKLREMHDFYASLGFRLTDSYPGRGVFLRAAGANDHHNLFLLSPPGAENSLHHLCCDVRDIHELFGGGLAMDAAGWQTYLGPGRHPVSSGYFWYFKNPCGGAAEYNADSDRATDAWQPREWTPGPEAFAEWAFPAGAKRYSGLQNAKP